MENLQQLLLETSLVPHHKTWYLWYLQKLLQKHNNQLNHLLLLFIEDSVFLNIQNLHKLVHKCGNCLRSQKVQFIVV